MSSKRPGDELESSRPTQRQKPLALPVECGIFTHSRIRQQTMDEQLYNLRCELVFKFNGENGNSVISRLLTLNVIQMQTLLHDSVTGVDSWSNHTSFETVHKALNDICMTTVIIDDYAAVDTITNNAKYHLQLGTILRDMQSYCLNQNCFTPDKTVALFENEDADYRTMVKKDPHLRRILFNTLKMISSDGIIKYNCFDGDSTLEIPTDTA
jgi:hypothetical protein